MTKDEILKEFQVFSLGTGGIGSWLTEDTDEAVFERLSRIDQEPLTKAQLNQLLVFGHEAPLSDDFFQYYWLSVPEEHPYAVDIVSGFQKDWTEHFVIRSLDHLKWGLCRLYIDGLLWFGNVRTAYRKLRCMSQKELSTYFGLRRFDTEATKRRGPALPLKPIHKDSRYLISEMACKSYGDRRGNHGELKEALSRALQAHREQGGGRVTIRKLLEGGEVTGRYAGRQQEFIFSPAQ